jgi:LacI family transcriptional regulator
VEHLYLLGHRTIAFIRGPKNLGDTAPRWRGIQSLAKATGLELDSRLIRDLPESQDPISSFEAGYKLTEELVAHKRAFTALMAFDDVTALGAIRALTKSGLRVPEHCSVIGFDDVPACGLYTPPLTTVRQPMEAMGAMAANLVVEGINAVLAKREVPAVHRKMTPELALRESTHRFPNREPRPKTFSLGKGSPSRDGHESWIAGCDWCRLALASPCDLECQPALLPSSTRISGTTER